MAKFNIRARTVDLLGRQQIASISTAISELFKNAHDAYANTVEVDYFRDDGLFVLRDDGMGMSREDFEERWLTLGTDSKVGSKSSLSLPPPDKGQQVRPILGEKGIGRLAIAIIGKQVLALTRAREAGKPSKTLTAAYIHWGMFELPGIDLDEVVIPLKEFNSKMLPNGQDVEQMISLSLQCLEKLESKIDKNVAAEIRKEMQAFQVNPAEISEYLDGPQLTGGGSGTHFYIKPADKIIQDDIDTREEDNRATRFEKNLIGFTNTMTPGHVRPRITTKFRDHVDIGEPVERVGEKAFFSPEEFREVDHHISGRFDEFGQFQGKVGVYQTEPIDYVLNWRNSDGRPTACGPFNFSIAVVQSEIKDSLVEPGQHARLFQKLRRHGGIYIYKDGIRVQPYGGTEYDFLDVERRRTQKASRFYYSFRNMMGAVELSSACNAELVEKAGREGFRENRAYRQFRSILINFLIQSAADFFVEQGKYSEEWSDTRSELNKLDEVRKKREKQSRERKLKFSASLEKYFEDVDAGAFEIAARTVLDEFEELVEKELASSKEASAKALSVGRFEAEAKAKLDGLRRQTVLSKPRGVGLNKELLNNWRTYQADVKRVHERTLDPTERKLEDRVQDIVQTNKLNLKPGLRLNAAIRRHTDERVKSIRRQRTQTEETLTDLTKNVREATQESFRSVSKVVDSVLVDLERIQASGDKKLDFSVQRESLQGRVDEAFEEQSDKLQGLANQLEVVLGSLGPDGSSMLEITEALEEENEALRERQEVDFQLSQIGMALNTINHEFGKTAGALRDGFRQLKSWANANPDLDRLYEDMRVSFDHLDNYLALFSPLDKRLQSAPTDIEGFEIFDFVSSLFDQRLQRHQVSFKATDEFKRLVVHGYRAEVYPVYVNLVDNAIYWVSAAQHREKKITIFMDGSDVCIEDNGTGVSSIDMQNIFELNFSRKPGGMGMGLHISRQLLHRMGYQLSVESKWGHWTRFRISGTNSETAN